jgi:hypothetical protein
MLWTQPVRPALFEVGVFPVFYINVGDGPFYGFRPRRARVQDRRITTGEAVDPAMDRVCGPEDEGCCATASGGCSRRRRSRWR